MVALVAFGSVYVITRSVHIAMVFSLLPLLLGSLNILSGFAYSLTATAFVIAAFFAMMPQDSILVSAVREGRVETFLTALLESANAPGATPVTAAAPGAAPTGASPAPPAVASPTPPGAIGQPEPQAGAAP